MAGKDFECDFESIQHCVLGQIQRTPFHGQSFITDTMATVYKSLSKANGSKDEETTSNGPRKNKQRVLILSSRGVTYR